MNTTTADFFATKPNSDPIQQITHDTSEINAIFVHSSLDDAGLSPAEFRIFCHLSRRAGMGSAYPAVETIAKVCRMNTKTVRRSLKRLVDMRMIIRRYRPSQTALYTLTKPSWWLPANLQPELALAADPSQNEPGLPSQNEPGLPSQNEPGLPSQNEPGLPSQNEPGLPSQNEPGEGNPLKVIPLKVPPVVPPGTDPESKPVVEDPVFKQATEVYQAYPRKVGRPGALRSIAKAIRNIGFDSLLAKTKQFAQARAGADPTFTPNPATWFNQERYADDPATWASARGRNGSSKTALVEQFVPGRYTATAL